MNEAVLGGSLIPPPSSLEWDVVVHLVEPATTFLRCRPAAPGPNPGTGGNGLSRHGLCAATLAPAEHLHFVRDDFGCIALLSLLILPLTRAQRAFDVDLAALLQVFAGDLGEPSEERDTVPLGTFLFFATLVLPGVGGGNTDVRNRTAFGHIPHFRVAAEVADQDHFVD